MDKFNCIKAFQDILFSPNLTHESITSRIDEFRKELSNKEIDHQFILAFSFDYSKFSILAPLLSNTALEANDFIHFDQQLILLFLQANFSLLEMIKDNCMTKIFYQDKSSYILDSNIYDFLESQGQIVQKPQKSKSNRSKASKAKTFGENIVIKREKTPIEEVIEKDDLEQLRFLTNSDNFDYNSTIIKENKLFNYSKVPLLSYCIEKQAQKCFKYIFINGADPLQKSFLYSTSKKSKNSEEPIWDSFGFAGAIGDISIIKILNEKISNISDDLLQGCIKFHRNDLLSWLLKEHNDLLSNGLYYSIDYENYEAFDFFFQNKIGFNSKEEI